MMSNIKSKKNDMDEQLEHPQDAEIVIRQKSNAILKKAIQSEIKNDNEKILNYKFNKNDAVNYTALVEKKRAQSKNLKVKRKYQILLKRNKKLQIFFRNDEISVSIKRKRSVVATSNDSLNKTF